MKILLSLSLLVFILSSCAAQTNSVGTNSDGSVTLFDNGSSSVTITRNGNVGIDQSNPQDKLEVNGQIHAKSVKVDLKEWADFVFDPDYELVRLREIQRYIEKNGHLPDIPSAEAVAEQGIELAEMNRLLLQKIEELTLHLIEKDQEISEMKSLMENLTERVKKMEHAETQQN